MAIRISDTEMTSDTCAAWARWSEYAADGRGAWIVSGYPNRLFSRNSAITAMTLAEAEAAGNGDSPQRGHDPPPDAIPASILAAAAAPGSVVRANADCEAAAPCQVGWCSESSAVAKT
jgi:hypothetical protein